ncbi:MAG: hypothetical protein U1F68_15850 [Gammaproteobacteria bacterium]
MTEKLLWPEINARYSGEWIVLTDHVWETAHPHPREGVVLHHCQTKREQNMLLKEQKTALPKRVALIYAGEPPPLPDGVFLNANLVRLR